MRARLERLGVSGVRARTFHSAALAQLRYFRPDAVGKDPGVEGAARSGRSRTRSRRRTSSAPRATSRPRSSGRRTAASRRSATCAALGRARAADPARPDAPGLPRYEERKAAEGLIDFEDLLELAIRLFDDEQRASPSSASGTARSPSTSTRTSTCSSRRCSTAGSAAARRPLRGRRRLPVDLRVHGCDARAPARRAGALSARDGRSGWRRTTARRRRCSSSRTGSCRSSAARRRCCARRVPDGPEPEVRPFATPEAEGAFLVERIRGRRVSARGGRDPLPHERPPGRLRGGAARGGDPVPGRRRCSPARRLVGCCARSTRPRRPRKASGRSPLEHGWLPKPAPTSSASASSTRQTDLARLVAARGGARRRRGADFGAELERRFGDGGGAAPRRPPAHLPRRQGPRVRGGAPPATRGEGAAAQAGAHAGRASRRSGASSTSA